MAHPLYYTDCYATEFDATIIENPTPTSITLDTIGFYPTGGGQPFDTGTIQSADGRIWAVQNVTKSQGLIMHELDGPAPSPGTAVHCVIDWKRRFGHMRYHTSCHILCAVIHQKTKAMITGNQIGLDHTRIDFNLEPYDRSMIETAIQEANEIIKKGLPITLSVLTPEEALKIPNLVKLEDDRSEKWGQGPQMNPHGVRVVSIHGLDTQACGGTHVKSTEEIGRILLERIDNKGKSNRRVYFTIEPAP